MSFVSSPRIAKRIVLKVGGAALFHPEGVQRQILPLLEEYREDQVLLVAGGGDLVESMRSIHKIYPEITADAMHWRCVELLRHNMEICHDLIPLPGAIRSALDFQRLLSSAPTQGQRWICVDSFYSRDSADSIPEKWRPSSDWSTTTDAIAWLLAKMVSADMLVLMKQCSIDPQWSLAEAAERGVVDSEIARLSALDRESSLRITLRQG
jgi:5-(aminomethyl)-3-furanmethanol phosphate kinase